MTQNAPDEPARLAWIGPLLSTLLTLPAAFVAFAFAALSPMACDSCTDAQSALFDPSYDTAFTVFQFGLTVPAALLLSAWALPWQQRLAARRALLAVLAPVSVLALYLLFAGLVDWP
ncbi:hypothetical protein [Streptomyces sp. NPDC046925]|uniref:hypothetical protein n=1 Tax=Streptomyces sp. NPDC046925 TaxID=3155375 RepID=UPI0033F197CE